MPKSALFLFKVVKISERLGFRPQTLLPPADEAELAETSVSATLWRFPGYAPGLTQ